MQKSKCKNTVKDMTPVSVTPTTSNFYPYAVVHFLSEDSFSEVPTNWILESNSTSGEEAKFCWWPATKNVSTLIENRTQPEKTWAKYNIEILKYCCKCYTEYFI